MWVRGPNGHTGGVDPMTIVAQQLHEFGTEVLAKLCNLMQTGYALCRVPKSANGQLVLEFFVSADLETPQRFSPRDPFTEAEPEAFRFRFGIILKRP